MKIATWNVERLKHRNQLDDIVAECNKICADIVVLTETDSLLQLDYEHCYRTPALDECEGVSYKPTENRVTIFSNYPCIRRHPTYDEQTAICVELETELGSLIVYGTIIGIFGNRHSSFILDLKQQMEDVRKLRNLADGFCICGDFNCSFADNYYFTKEARAEIARSFSESDIKLLTASEPMCIDHIAVSGTLARENKIVIEEWNLDKRLSDHKGIAASFDSPKNLR